MIDKIVGADDITRYEQARWHLLGTEESTFVLGDSPVVAVGVDGRIGMTAKYKVENTREVYLPIGPSCVLVAAFHDACPSLGSEQVLAASVRLSRSAFFADRDEEGLRSLAKTIGTAEPLLECPSDEMLRDSWGKMNLD